MRLSWSSAVTLRSTNSPDFAVDLAHILGDFAAEILVDLDDLQLGFGDLALGLRNRSDELRAFALDAGAVALQRGQAGDRHQIFLPELAHAFQLFLDQINLA